MYMSFNAKCSLKDLRIFVCPVRVSSRTYAFKTKEHIYPSQPCKTMHLGQVGLQGQHTWRQALSSPQKIAPGRRRHAAAQHEGARRCERTCADGDNLDEALALVAKDKLQRGSLRFFIKCCALLRVTRWWQLWAVASGSVRLPAQRVCYTRHLTIQIQRWLRQSRCSKPVDSGIF